MQHSTAEVLEYFWREPRIPGTQLAGSAGSIRAGTRISIGADLNDGFLHNVGFRVFACPHIIACCNFLAEQLQGEAVEELQRVSVERLQLKFDIPVEKAGKLLILKDAATACYQDYRHQQAAG